MIKRSFEKTLHLESNGIQQEAAECFVKESVKTVVFQAKLPGNRIHETNPDQSWQWRFNGEDRVFRFILCGIVSTNPAWKESKDIFSVTPKGALPEFRIEELEPRKIRVTVDDIDPEAFWWCEDTGV